MIEVRFTNGLTLGGVYYQPGAVASFVSGTSLSLITAGYAVATGEVSGPTDPTDPVPTPGSTAGGTVKSVNDVFPDATGDVTLTGANISGVATTAAVTAAKDRATHTGFQTADTISDLATEVRANVRPALAAGSGITLTTDSQNVTTVTSTGSGSGVAGVVDPSDTAVYVIGDTRLAALGVGDVLAQRHLPTHLDPVTMIESIQDTVAGMLVVNGMSKVYDDPSGVLTLTAAGGGGGGVGLSVTDNDDGTATIT